MRVNVDSKMLVDPRFKRLGQRLGITHFEAFGRVLPVWNAAYETRSALLGADDIDALAELPGFASALVTSQLASAEEDMIRLKGVEDRIGWLLEQDRKRELALLSKKARMSFRKPVGTTPVGQDEEWSTSQQVPRDVPGDVPRDVPRDVPGDVPRDVPLQEQEQEQEQDLGSGSSSSSPELPDSVRRAGRGKRKRREESERDPGWTPNQSHRDLAARIGVADVEYQAGRFRDHHDAKGTLFRDWDAAFRTWLNNSKEFGRNGATAQSGGRRSGGGDGLDHLLKIANGEIA